jgi:hypothetical protein
MKRSTATTYRSAFARLEKGGCDDFTLRQLAQLYGVASILYYRHGVSPVSDHTFDELCRYLLTNLDTAQAQGADLLEEGMLRAGSGYDLDKFVKPLHEIAAAYAEEYDS